MSVPQLNDEHRGEQILAVFDTAFGELLAADPAAFRVKFRKMAASAFAFYRGTRASSTTTWTRRVERGGPFLDERTSRVWIHGDLHAENFGTYMDANGRLIFNVNDFDEAYVGPFTWDLKRFVRLPRPHRLRQGARRRPDHRAGARSTRARTASASTRWPPAPRATRCRPFTLDTAQGPLLDALRDARSLTRFGLLDSMTEIRDFERRFAPGGGSIELDAATRYKVLAAFDGYLETLPEPSLARPDSYRVKDVVGRRGIGIGSAGLPVVQHPSGGPQRRPGERRGDLHQAGPDPGGLPARHRPGDPRLLPARGPPHGDLAARPAGARRPVAGLDRAGRRRASWSPRSRRTRSTWTGATSTTRRRSRRVVADLGRATATMHAAADDQSGESLVPFSTERAIDAAIAADEDGFAALLVDFAHTYGARARADHQIFVDLFRNGRIPGL